MHLDEHSLARSRQAGGMNPIRLLLADDHLMITEALASRLSAVPDIWAAARCAATDPNLFAIVKGVRPDVIAIEAEPFAGGICHIVGRLIEPSPPVHVRILSPPQHLAP